MTSVADGSRQPCRLQRAWWLSRRIRNINGAILSSLLDRAFIVWTAKHKTLEMKDLVLHHSHVTMGEEVCWEHWISRISWSTLQQPPSISLLFLSVSGLCPANWTR